MPTVELLSSGFIAGVTVVFGVVALGMAQAFIEPEFGRGAGKVAGSLAFGIGLVFLVVGRSELFTKNFFDPVAAAIDKRVRSPWRQLARLWAGVLVMNLVGGAIMVAVFTVEGTLPVATNEALLSIGEEITAKDALATFTRGVAAGTLLTLLSYLLHAVDSVGSRIVLAYLVGVFLALGPFDHVVVSVLHLLFAEWVVGDTGAGEILTKGAAAAGGNLAGGLLLMTLTHTAQVKGSRTRS